MYNFSSAVFRGVHARSRTTVSDMHRFQSISITTTSPVVLILGLSLQASSMTEVRCQVQCGGAIATGLAATGS